MEPALTARDLLRSVTVEDPQLSPDGALVAWTRGRIVPELDAVRTELVLTAMESADAGRTTVLTEARGLRLVRWSPDGRWLACAMAVDGGSDVFAFGPFGEGSLPPAPRRVTEGLGPIAELTWAPGGDALALVLPRHDGPPKPAGPAAGVLRVTRLRWKRDGGGLVGDRFDHLGIVPFDPVAAPVDAVRWLVRGRVDVAGPRWSPDGRTLAFVANLDDADWEVRRRSAIYLVDARRPDAVPRRLAGFADLRAQALAWSPDGNTLAVTGHEAEGFGHYGAQRLWTVDARSGARRAITTDADGTFGNAAYTDTGGGGDQGPVWSADGAGVYAILSAAHHVRLVHVGLAGAITPLTPADRVVAGFSASTDRQRFVLACQPRDRTTDLERLDLGAGGAAATPVRLTDHGGELLAGVAPALPQRMRVDDGRGPALDAWVLLPDERFGPKVPVVLYTGGGPGGMRTDNLQFEWQLFAAHGYAVVWVNARGCQGYGDPFCTAILGSWGRDDHLDQMRALDAALAAVPRLDAGRQAIAGGSYGGYAVAWAIAHTDRFQAAVADRVVVDKLAAFGMSDIGPQRAFEFGGARPWEDPAAYLAQSPIARLGRTTTPTLVVHSAEDHRCTVGQGEALYASLRTLGVETRLVRFPNESHGLSRGGRPWHRVRRLQEYLDWFGRHLAPVPASA